MVKITTKCKDYLLANFVTDQLTQKVDGKHSKNKEYVLHVFCHAFAHVFRCNLVNFELI